jgi:hypothetical protein
MPAPEEILNAYRTQLALGEAMIADAVDDVEQMTHMRDELVSGKVSLLDAMVKWMTHAIDAKSAGIREMREAKAAAEKLYEAAKNYEG